MLHIYIYITIYNYNYITILYNHITYINYMDKLLASSENFRDAPVLRRHFHDLCTLFSWFGGWKLRAPKTGTLGEACGACPPVVPTEPLGSGSPSPMVLHTILFTSPAAECAPLGPVMKATLRYLGMERNRKWEPSILFNIHKLFNVNRLLL